MGGAADADMEKIPVVRSATEKGPLELKDILDQILLATGDIYRWVQLLQKQGVLPTGCAELLCEFLDVGFVKFFPLTQGRKKLLAAELQGRKAAQYSGQRTGQELQVRISHKAGSG